jgi:hypothetical protein
VSGPEVDADPIVGKVRNEGKAERRSYSRVLSSSDSALVGGMVDSIGSSPVIVYIKSTEMQNKMDKGVAKYYLIEILCFTIVRFLQICNLDRDRTFSCTRKQSLNRDWSYS